jgi:tetrahydromethanopterin S-methyltransferase subunit E
MLILLIAVLLALPAFFMWSALHELSHYLMARRYRTITEASFRLYPHVEGSNFVFASVLWEHDGAPFTPAEDAAISFAPRILDLLAVILTPLATLMPEPWLATSWCVLIGAGLVDLSYGSIGYTAASDLQRFAMGGGHSVWVVRIIGWALAVSSAALTVGLLIAHWA